MCRHWKSFVVPVALVLSSLFIMERWWHAQGERNFRLEQEKGVSGQHALPNDAVRLEQKKEDTGKQALPNDGARPEQKKEDTGKRVSPGNATRPEQKKEDGGDRGKKKTENKEDRGKQVTPKSAAQLEHEKEGRGQHILPDAVAREIANHTGKSPSSKANYSILSDPYYVVQVGNVLKNASGIKCLLKKDVIVNYFMCPRAPRSWDLGPPNMGIWQRRTFGNLLRLMQQTPGAALIDIGANIGPIVLSVMKALGKDRKAIALEADPDNVRRLIVAMARNEFNLQNWGVLQRALADTVDEQVMLVMRPSIPTVGGLKSKTADTKNYYTGKKVPVLTSTFDSHLLPVAKALNISVAILKMDIEGSECIALQAADQFFAEVFVPYIVIEISMSDGHSTNECIEKMIEILHKLYYVPFTPTSMGLEEVLDRRNYTNWQYYDMIWKKIL